MPESDIQVHGIDVVAVFLGKRFEKLQEDCRKYQRHPNVMWKPWDSCNGSSPLVPINTKAVILTPDIPTLLQQSLFGEVRRRNIIHVSRDNASAIQQMLDRWIPESKQLPSSSGSDPELEIVDGVSKAGRGSLKAFIEAEADLSKGSADEARRLLPIAQAKGIKTTFGSLSQGISVAKRKSGRGDIPLSVMPNAGQLQALKILDDSLAGLALVRDYVMKTEQENLEMKKILERARAVFEKKD